MLGLHRTPEGLETDLRPKNGQTRGYSGVGRQGRMFLLCHPPDGHKLLLGSRNNTGLLANEIVKLYDCFYHQKRPWNLSISLASDPTRSWILLWSLVFAGWSWFTRLPRMSFSTVVSRSQVSHANLCWVTQVIRGGRAQVVGRSLIDRKASQVSRRLVASVLRRSGRGSGARVYADRLTNVVRGSRARKSVVVRSQFTLITWPIIHFLFIRMSVAPRNRCKR